MTKKQFWQGASNRGFICGVFLFAMNIIGWLLKLEAGDLGWIQEFLFFLVICPVIIVSGRCNAAASGAGGYSYGRAVGFVLATMMFSGIVFGVGQFMMYNFIAPDYYGPMIEKAVDDMAGGAIAANPAMMDLFVENREMYIGMMRNPFVLIFSNMINITVKGGFLGLVLCAFFYKKPDIFADDMHPEQKEDNESGSE